VVTRGFFFGGFLLGGFALVHSVQLLSARCRTGGCYFSAPWRDDCVFADCAVEIRHGNLSQIFFKLSRIFYGKLSQVIVTLFP
jgi:hypothetical protein